MWSHSCSYFVWMINRYNLLMGRVYVQWPYVFGWKKNLLTEVLFEPMSFLCSSHTWHHALIQPDGLVLANVCKLSLGVFYTKRQCSALLEVTSAFLSLPSHLVCRSIVEYTIWVCKAGDRPCLRPSLRLQASVRCGGEKKSGKLLSSFKFPPLSVDFYTFAMLPGTQHTAY